MYTRNVIIFTHKKLHSIAEFEMFKQYKYSTKQNLFLYSGKKHDIQQLQLHVLPATLTYTQTQHCVECQ